MATHSSSESWSGTHGADVIDLDKFMRGVRPPRHGGGARTHAPRYSNRNDLVVDSGGLARKPPSSSSTVSSTPRVTDDTYAHAHNKRFSHDSGVSDGSYVKRRSKPHRRYSIAESAGIKAKREPVAGPSGSSGSIRAFRTACERTLRDQQHQLARVAQLCERLGERRERSQTEPTTKSESSDLSSSSRSTRDPRRKDKSRAQECKTYKIIMSKLDELNRMFLLRRPPASRRAPPAAPSGSGSVSVSDKLVATDDPRGPSPLAPRQLVTRRVETETRQLVEQAVGAPSERTERAERTERLARLANLQAVKNAYSLDIAPQEAVCKLYPNIATESVVKRGSSDEGSRTTLGDTRGFDLDDPIQLYAQAKRLQALHMTSRRARSSARTATTLGRGAGAAGAGAGGKQGGGGVTLCALCREYWRAVRGFLVAQFSYPREEMPYACS